MNYLLVFQVNYLLDLCIFISDFWLMLLQVLWWLSLLLISAFTFDISSATFSQFTIALTFWDNNQIYLVLSFLLINVYEILHFHPNVDLGPPVGI